MRLNKLFLAALIACGAASSQAGIVFDSSKDGVVFECGDAKSVQPVYDYLKKIGVDKDWLDVKVSGDGYNFRLKEDLSNAATTDLASDARFDIQAGIVKILDPSGSEKMVATVSQKEVALALMHPGRMTKYTGAQCGLEQFKDDIGIRQMTVAWTQSIGFGWPDGTPAQWNEKLWRKGTPLPGVDLHKAFTDAVVNPSDYSIGCYTAAKIVVSASILDYYKRVKKSPQQAAAVEAAMMQDGDPLVHVEPTKFWSFESDYDKSDQHSGKLMRMVTGVHYTSIVPGDWVYMLNTDPKTAQKTGYEGSNGIYLGMNKFSDYYNDHEHAYIFEQKLDEVYQWRNGVFSRTRDANKVTPLTAEQINDLKKSPAEGGFLISDRLVPRLF